MLLLQPRPVGITCVLSAAGQLGGVSVPTDLPVPCQGAMDGQCCSALLAMAGNRAVWGIM